MDPFPVHPPPLFATYANRAVAACTVSAALAVKLETLSVAVILAVPALSPCAKPVVPLIGPTVAVSEVQATGCCGAWVVPSLKTSIAVNCTVVPVAIVEVAGVTWSDCGAGGVTFSVVELVVNPSQLVAEIVVVPWPTVVAVPVLSMVATVGSELAQVTWPVMSCCAVPPEAIWNVPVAVNACVSPSARLGFGGPTVIEFSKSTSSGAAAEETPSRLATIFVVPRPTPVANPVLSIDAALVFDEAQLTVVD